MKRNLEIIKNLTDDIIQMDDYESVYCTHSDSWNVFEFYCLSSARLDVKPFARIMRAFLAVKYGLHNDVDGFAMRTCEFISPDIVSHFRSNKYFDFYKRNVFYFNIDSRGFERVDNKGYVRAL